MTRPQCRSCHPVVRRVLRRILIIKGYPLPMRVPLFGLLASASVATLLGAAPALAQQQDAPTTLSDIVVTGSQVALPPAYAGGQVARGGRVGLFGALNAMDTPFSSTSFTEKLARDQQARSVGDVLQNDPAVRLTKGFGNFQELYVIRGFPVYSDDMTYNGLYGVLPRQFVAAELLERVEVFRGATAFLNGAAPGGSGVGGAVNLVPKRAGDAPLNRLTAGWEGGDQIYAAADLSRRFGQDGDWGLRPEPGQPRRRSRDRGRAPRHEGGGPGSGPPRRPGALFGRSGLAGQSHRCAASAGDAERRHSARARRRQELRPALDLYRRDPVVRRHARRVRRDRRRHHLGGRGRSRRQGAQQPGQSPRHCGRILERLSVRQRPPRSGLLGRCGRARRFRHGSRPPPSGRLGRPGAVAREELLRLLELRRLRQQPV